MLVGSKSIQVLPNGKMEDVKEDTGVVGKMSYSF